MRAFFPRAELYEIAQLRALSLLCTSAPNPWRVRIIRFSARWRLSVNSWFFQSRNASAYSCREIGVLAKRSLSFRCNPLSFKIFSRLTTIAFATGLRYLRLRREKSTLMSLNTSVRCEFSQEGWLRCPRMAQHKSHSGHPAVPAARYVAEIEIFHQPIWGAVPVAFPASTSIVQWPMAR